MKPRREEHLADVRRQEERGRQPYVRPKLERLGNVRDVLGKTGPTRDIAPPTARRP